MTEAEPEETQAAALPTTPARVQPDDPPIRSFQIPEPDAPEPEEIDDATNAPPWIWDGRSWGVTEKPGSTYTVHFLLRVKDTDGNRHYASNTSLSFLEFNRRFADRRYAFVSNKRYLPVKTKPYEKFKKLCFETWKASAIRTDHATNRTTARHS